MRSNEEISEHELLGKACMVIELVLRVVIEIANVSLE